MRGLCPRLLIDPGISHCTTVTCSGPWAMQLCKPRVWSYVSGRMAKRRHCGIVSRIFQPFRVLCLPVLSMTRTPGGRYMEWSSAFFEPVFEVCERGLWFVGLVSNALSSGWGAEWQGDAQVYMCRCFPGPKVRDVQRKCCTWVNYLAISSVGHSHMHCINS